MIYPVGVAPEKDKKEKQFKIIFNKVPIYWGIRLIFMMYCVFTAMTISTGTGVGGTIIVLGGKAKLAEEGSDITDNSETVKKLVDNKYGLDGDPDTVIVAGIVYLIFHLVMMFIPFAGIFWYAKYFWYEDKAERRA